MLADPTRPAARLLFALTLGIATWLALTPTPADLSGLTQGDKLAHLAGYLGLALLLDFSWPAPRFGWRKWALLLAYGLSIEAAQSTIPSRDFSLLDLLANALGIALYASGVRQMLKRSRIQHLLTSG